tara:strand:+ start:31423 stop:33882 length:2460 start_codon:yes stop_codon:yes gene_type:complete
MSQIIKIKHSTTTGNKPTSLSAGELALNVKDGHFFFGDGSDVQDFFHFGATSARTLSITRELVVTGQTDLRSNLIMNSNRIMSLSDPTLAQDAATKAYVDSFTPSGLHYLPLSGGTITGPLNVSGNTALGGDISLIDNKKLKLGHSGDLEIYHNGSNSYIDDTGTGTIFYRSGTQTFQNAAGSKTMATFNAANSVDLNYNNNTKFKTTNTGIDVTGEVKGDSLDIDGNSDISGALNVSGATDIDGTLNVNANLITNVANPTSAQDAATKGYVDSLSGATDTLQEVTNNGNTTTNSIMIGSSSAPGYPLDVLGDIHSSAVIRSSGLYSTFGTFSTNINANGNIVGDGATNITGMNNITATGAVSISGLTSVGDNIIMNSNKITSLLNPTASQDAATKSYVDSFTPNGLHYLPLSGGTVTGALNVSGNTEVKGALRARGGLQLGADDVVGNNARIYFGTPGNKNHPQFKHTEVNQLILDRGSDSNTLVEFNTAQHVDGPAVKITGDIDLGDGYKLYLDGGTDTYLTTGGVNNIIDFYANNTNIVKFQPAGTLIATPLNVSGATDIDGTLNLNANLITNVTNPTSAQDAATKAYVDQYATSGVSSVAITGTDGIDVDSGSPITSSGTITLGLSSIPNSSLANSSVSYGGVSVSLGAADATPAFNLSDATAYPGDSSLVTTGTITSGVWNNDRLFSLQTSEGAWMGDYVTFGSEVATTAGTLYYFNGTTWAAADASAVNTSTGMLGIALGDSNAAGLLIRGMYGTLTYDPGSSGEVLYVSEVAGKVTNTAPTTSAAVVRVIGYAMSDTPQIWFNPDNTWVELS